MPDNHQPDSETDLQDQNSTYGCLLTLHILSPKWLKVFNLSLEMNFSKAFHRKLYLNPNTFT